MNDKPKSNRTRSGVGSKALPLIVVAIILPAVYLLAGPWLVLFVFASFTSLDSDSPPARAVELFIYPAMLLAENVEFYGDYFWYVFSPLGG